MSLTLRDYQADILNKIYQSMATGHKRPLVVAPCGSGKTIQFCDLAARTQAKHKNIIVLVHRIELYQQTVKTFTDSHIPLDTIEIHMAQTYSRHLAEHVQPDLIITDEAHFSMANTWRKIYDHFPDVYVIGFSATPCRLDQKPLGDVYDDLILGPTTADLIALGYLAPYRYFGVSVADLSQLKRKGADYDMQDAEAILSQRAVYGDVIETYKRLADNKRTVVYCTTVSHSENMTAEFVSAGYRAEHIDGTTPPKQRTEIIERFRSGATQILCNCDIVSTGFDLADIECCIMLRPTQSTALFIQQAGRALRFQPGKTAIILDHVSNFQRHNLPDDPHDWSLTATMKPASQYREDGTLKVKQCPACYFTFKAGPAVCPNCGFPVALSRDEIENIKGVKLQEIHRREADHLDAARLATRDRMRGKELKDCRTLFEVMAWCKTHGRTSGFGYAYAKRMRLIK